MMHARETILTAAPAFLLGLAVGVSGIADRHVWIVAAALIGAAVGVRIGSIGPGMIRRR